VRSELPVKELLGNDNTAVWLQLDQFRCVVQDFQYLSKSGQLRDFQMAVSLYRGPFLSEFNLDS